ncbi:hypothetical protein N9M41_03045 [Rhodopirellula sp.]|nr:hypothetical protein [Rhodopirellula sp.]
MTSVHRAMGQQYRKPLNTFSIRMFHHYIGIDYSGRGTCTTRTSAIQVYRAETGLDASVVNSPASTENRRRNWCRQEVAEWLLKEIEQGKSFIAGIDHGFSLPVSYMQRFSLNNWPEFLNDFCNHWPTDQPDVSVDDVRKKLSNQLGRIGKPDEYRLAERWTSSAKSVFQFDVQGSVAKSTHAGIPWIQKLRTEAGDRLHCWPFDGWKIPKNRCVIAEVFPSIFRQRYPRGNRHADAQDAYSVARWLSEADQNLQLQHFFEPFLTIEQRKLANLEGWILGIM